MNNEILLSVVVPVYNSALYLRKCITSILNQTYNKIELILIDDGSTDASPEICDQYAEEYKNVFVLHKENSGQNSARKMGIDSAKGEYITFVDSDDWIENKLYADMLSFTGNDDTDLITSGLIFEWEDRKRFLIDVIEEGNYNAEQIEKEILPLMTFDSCSHRQGINASMSCKIFKLHKLKRLFEDLDTKITYGEDGAVVYSYIPQISKITVTHFCGYHYVQRENSMIHVYDGKSFDNLFRLDQYLRKKLLGGSQDAVLEDQIAKYIVPFLGDALRKVFHVEFVTYIFPFDKVPYKSRIILYGAGDVGRSYWQCLSNGMYAEIILWVDKNYNKIGHSAVRSPEMIFMKEYDYIVIAVIDEYTAECIKEELISRNINENKIIWSIPRHVISQI